MKRILGFSAADIGRLKRNNNRNARTGFSRSKLGPRVQPDIDFIMFSAKGVVNRYH